MQKDNWYYYRVRVDKKDFVQTFRTRRKLDIGTRVLVQFYNPSKMAPALSGPRIGALDSSKGCIVGEVSVEEAASSIQSGNVEGIREISRVISENEYLNL